MTYRQGANHKRICPRLRRHSRYWLCRMCIRPRAAHGRSSGHRQSDSPLVLSSSYSSGRTAFRRSRSLAWLGWSSVAACNVLPSRDGGEGRTTGAVDVALAAAGRSLSNSHVGESKVFKVS